MLLLSAELLKLFITYSHHAVCKVIYKLAQPWIDIAAFVNFKTRTTFQTQSDMNIEFMHNIDADGSFDLEKKGL